jgi:serine/threonine-protein kinase
MGAVYQAFDRVLEEEVAVKVLRAEVAASNDHTRRFRSEIKLARRVRQPNVCAIHEYGEDGDLRFISMELIDGTDLKHVIQSSGRFEINEAFRITRQIAEGLKAIHAIGVIHRDLKAANIMLDQRRQVHVMDFGIAKQFGPEAAASATITGHILGTPEYMSPEQARGQPLDPRTDIYALGVVMFEIFTGSVPFQAETPVATLFKQLQDPPPVNDPRLPRHLSGILGKALAKDARDRYASVADFIDALDLAHRTTQGLEHAAEPPDVATVAEQPALSGDIQTIIPATTIVPSPTTNGSRAPTPNPQLETTLPPSSLPVPLPLPQSVRFHTPPRVAPPPLPASIPSGPPPTPSRPHARAFPRMGHYALAAASLVAVALLWAGTISRQRDERPGRAASEHDDRSPDPAPTALPAVTGDEALSSTATTSSSPAGVASSAVSRLGPTHHARSDGPGQTIAAAAPLARTPPSRHEATQPSPSSPAVPSPAAGQANQTSSSGTDRGTRLAAEAGGANAEENSGLLQIVARPWADIAVDGAQVGTTPFRALKVTPGKHVVVFTHPDYKPFQRQVLVQSGKTSRIEVDLSWEAFRR